MPPPIRNNKIIESRLEKNKLFIKNMLCVYLFMSNILCNWKIHHKKIIELKNTPKTFL